MPPTIRAIDCSINHTIFVKLSFSSFTIPPAIAVFSKSIIVKIHFSIANYPPTISIACHGICIKIHLAIFYYPPAISIARHSIIKSHLSSNHMPPTIRAIDCPINHTVFVKLYFSIFTVPPAITVLGKSIIIKIHLAIANYPPAISIARHGIIKGHFSSNHVPPTIFTINCPINHIIKRILYFPVFIIVPFPIYWTLIKPICANNKILICCST